MQVPSCTVPMHADNPVFGRAQRKDRLYLTFDLQDCKDPEITVKNDADAKCGRVSFRGKAHSHATGGCFRLVRRGLGGGALWWHGMRSDDGFCGY